jgi:hypothetical protein
MNKPSASSVTMSPLRIVLALALAIGGTYAFLLPGLTVARDLSDTAIRRPGVPQIAWRLHRDLTPRLESWARERIASGRAAHVALHDVPTTEWPIFTAVFYLMATEQLEASWEQGNHAGGERPMHYAAGAVAAARDLVMDPSHHTWVRTHWGDDYMHREDVFFRSLLIAALSSYERLTHDGTSLAVLRDQVDTLSRALDGSARGVLNDYPGECYPIDVLAGEGYLRHADDVLGTDHSAFFRRSLRAFTGDMADADGLVPYRVDVATGQQLQPSRGIGNSWVSLYAVDLWPAQARDWYSRYERSFWQDRGWAAGFREFARDTPDTDWLTEVDAGPVLDGFGTSANAFGIAAARRNGRFDHAYTLSTEMLAMSWPLPDGTLLAPRALSHAADAPYLGEAGILFFLTVAPAPGVPIVTGGHAPLLVYVALLGYFGVAALLSWASVRLLRPRARGRDAPPYRLIASRCSLAR